MKKLYAHAAVALACAAALSAHAQSSSVTIYGTVDLEIVKSNGGLANNPSNGITNSSNAYQMGTGHPSRIGFRGNEDLGGGLSAQFQIEHRFNADTGAISNANAFWHGLSYVQLTSVAAGKVYLGRNYTPAFLMAVRLDPFGWDGVGEMGVLQWGNYRTPDVSSPTPTSNGRSVTVGAVREANAVGYVSPSFSGFSVHTATSLSEASGYGRVMSLNGNYEAGPLFLSLNGEKVYKGIYQGQGLLQAGASYDFGVTRVMAYVARSTYGARVLPNGSTLFTTAAIPAANGGGTVSTAGGANRTHAKIFEIGAITPIGSGALKTGYIRVNPDGPNNLIQKLGIGYDYFLSKRTKLYVDGGYAKEDALSKSKLLALGIRHDF